MGCKGDSLVHWGFIRIYAEGLRYAAMIAVRIVCLIAGTSLLTYTTSPIVLTDAIERLLKPMAKLHLPVHELSLIHIWSAWVIRAPRPPRHWPGWIRPCLCRS